MTKIKEILDIKTGYSEVVLLKEEFKDKETNLKRMSRYRPIESHRKAFEILASSPYKLNSKRNFVLSGTFGTGKSHLCLMIANYFNKSSDNKHIRKFFDLYEQAEKEDNVSEPKAEILKTQRTKGKYLICMCDYDLNDSFETVILRSIQDALEREGIDEYEIDSIYLEAIKKINNWENNSDNYHYNSFKNMLEKDFPKWTIKKLKKSLKSFSRDALDIFKRIHKKVTTSEFHYSTDNLLEIIRGIKTSQIIENNFQGMLILFDEFDYQLEERRISLNLFQRFGEMCEKSFKKNFPIVFIATIHRSFTKYSDTYNKSDFRTVNDRIEEIPLATNGLEDIIGAVVNQKKEMEIWENEIVPKRNFFNSIANKCSQLGIFDWLSAPKLKEDIIINLYPMHPLATFSLIELSKDVGSNNRSVFKFFSEKLNEKGTFYNFINNNSIIDSEGNLNLYTIDLLIDYFSDAFSSDNEQLRVSRREIIRDYETTLREYNKLVQTSDKIPLYDDLKRKIIKGMAVLKFSKGIIDSDTLSFGLNIKEKNISNEFNLSLKYLVDNKVIFRDEKKGIYEFRKSDALDINHRINEEKDKKENKITNLFEDLNNMLNYLSKTKGFLKENQYKEPQNFNYNFLEDKRFKIEFTTLKEFEDKDFFVNNKNEIIRQSTVIEGYEAKLVIVICESNSEINKAIKLTKNNEFNEILVSIPKKEINLFDVVHTTKSAIAIKKDDLSTQDNALINDRLSNFDEKIKSKLQNYLDYKNVKYYSVDSKIIYKDKTGEPVDKVMENIYGDKHNLIKHNYLNKKHDKKIIKDSSLKEAINDLLNFTKEIEYNQHSSADTGDKRYLKEVFFDENLIKEISREGSRIICKINKGSNNFGKFPALKNMIKRMKNLEDEMSLLEFKNQYLENYGLGYGALMLFFAFALRYYRDEIMLIPEINEAGYLRIENYQTLFDLIYNDKYKNAKIAYRHLDDFEKKIIDKLFYLFKSDTEENNINVSFLYDLMVEWYDNLDKVSKIKNLYNNSSTKRFINYFNEIKSYDPRVFVVEKIKMVYGYEFDEKLMNDKIDEMISQFKKDKEKIEMAYTNIRNDIFSEIKDIYSSKAKTEDKLLEDIKAWYASIDDKILTLANDKNNEYVKSLLTYLPQDSSFEVIFLEKIPKTTISKVKNWTEDRRSMYAEEIKNAKRIIEKISIVEDPIIDFSNDKLKKDGNYIEYSDELNIIIKAKKEHSLILLSTNGKDPVLDNVQKIEEKNKIEHKIKKNKTIKIAAKDKLGNYSEVKSYEVVNRNNKYDPNIKEVLNFKQEKLGNKISEETQTTKKNFQMNVALPKDNYTLKLLIKNIFKLMKKEYTISDEEFLNTLKEILKEL